MNWEKHSKYLYKKLKTSNKPLSHFLKDINLSEYVIIKATSIFRIIEEKDIEKYASFMLIKKTEFDEVNFKRWNDLKINFKYLVKPFPNYDPTKKLKEL